MSRLQFLPYMVPLSLLGCGSDSESTPDAALVSDATPAGDSATDAFVLADCSGHQLPSEIEFEHEGITRSATLAGPGGIPDAPLALVLNFHGYSDSPEQQEDFSSMSASAIDNGYLVAYPRGTGALKGWNAGACCGSAASTAKDDVGFTAKLIDEIGAVACIDRSRVFATGYSNGGFLSHRLACELSESISAIAPVAGVMGIEDCSPSRSIPVIQFHGTSDAIVPYAGSALLGFPSVDDTMEQWRTRLGCSDAEPSVTFSEGDATCVEWSGCDERLVRCSIDGGGHTWPGGNAPIIRGKTSTDLDATAMMWQFFEAAGN